MYIVVRVSLATLTGLMLLVSGCNWEVEAKEGAPQGLAAAPKDGNCQDLTELPGHPKCGVVFPAELRGECNDCSDRGCTQNDPGLHDCECQVEGEQCWAQEEISLPDGGVQAPEFCAYQGQSCQCDDGAGRIYVCECEGGGDECTCRVPVPSGQIFDYEVECGR